MYFLCLSNANMFPSAVLWFIIDLIFTFWLHCLQPCNTKMPLYLYILYICIILYIYHLNNINLQHISIVSSIAHPLHNKQWAVLTVKVVTHWYISTVMDQDLVQEQVGNKEPVDKTCIDKQCSECTNKMVGQLRDKDPHRAYLRRGVKWS